MKIPPTVLHIGDPVLVRRQKWRIVNVRPGEGCHVVTLAGTDAHNTGVELRVVSPFDLVEPFPRLPPARRRTVGIHRWRSACRTILSAQGTSGSLTTAARAGIDLHPYQLEPALAVVRGLGSRVLIADEVGLGKTIQAGLLLSELRARGAADHVLVLSPAGLREQWAVELNARFGIEATIMDTREGRRRAALLPVGLDPWTTIQVAITSIDYVKRPEVLAAVRACRWDAVIVDEAHGAAAAGDRHDAAAELCGLASYVVLLTATPHNGDDRSFRSLCDLGARDRDPLLIFRRSRREIALGSSRRIHRLRIRPTSAEHVMHNALADLARAVALERDQSDGDGRLALSVLHKRALSSAYALEQSAARRVRSLALTPDDVAHQLMFRFDDPTGELDPADDAPDVSGPLLQDSAAERRLLQLVVNRALTAIPQQAKLAALRRLLARLDNRGERAIVFTEYRDTLVHVRDAIERQAATVVIHGGMTADERRAALDAFTNGDARILLATDAAGEGLNLHRTCRVVVNLELPWNPMRLEQRIGRVDRIGQARRVHVFHLIARQTGEERILERLKRRLAHAASELGTPDPLGIFDEGDERSPEVAGIRLLADGASEHERLRTIRAMTNPRGRGQIVCGPTGVVAPAERDALVTRARRRRLRLRLASRSLAIVRTSLDDADGRSVGVHLAPLAIVSTALGRTREISCAELESMDPTFLPWHAASRRMHRAFVERRVARDRAIARALDMGLATIQVGLFDHRAEHQHLAETGSRRALQDEVRLRIAAAERSSAIRLEPPRLALLLVV